MKLGIATLSSLTGLMSALNTDWAIVGTTLKRNDMTITAEGATSVDQLTDVDLYANQWVRDNNDDNTIQRFVFKSASNEILMKITIISEFLIDTNALTGTRGWITVDDNGASGTGNSCSHKIRANEAYNMKAASLKCDNLVSNCGETGIGETFKAGINYKTAVKTEHRMNYDVSDGSFEFRAYKECLKGSSAGLTDVFLCDASGVWPSAVFNVDTNCVNRGAGR